MCLSIALPDQAVVNGRCADTQYILIPWNGLVDVLDPISALTIGNLDLVPEERRVGGPGASYLMAPFVHVTPDHKGRFHDGTFGAFYGADDFETALFETVHHTQLFCAATDEAPGWIADNQFT